MHERHQQYLAHLAQRADDAVTKHGLQGVKAEVVLVLDVSKSMYAMYKSNMVAELATRLLALSLEFDDDGVIPAYAFGDTCRHLGDLTVRDFAGWIEREVIRTGNDFQNGCMYAPVIHEVCSYFFPEDWHRPTAEVRVGRIFKKRKTVYPTLSVPRVNPVYALFVTSGDCQDKIATTDAVRRSSRLPIFWQFIGLQSGKGAPTKFTFLEKLDTLGNTHVDNAGFFEVSDTRNDTVLFEGMCKEFPSYLALPKVAEMLAPAEAGGLATKGARGDVEVSHSADTASRMPAFDPEAGPPASQLDAIMRERRAAAAARAASKRSEKSRVDMAARDELVEPTSTLPSQASRTIKAANATRAQALLSEARKAAREASKVVPAMSTPATSAAEAEAAARRERRNRLETQRQPLPEKIEEAQVQLARQVERTVIRSSAEAGGDNEAEAPAIDTNDALRWDSSTRSVPAVTQEESTRTVTAISQEDQTRMVQTVEPDDDEEQAASEAQSALKRLQEIRARRAARGG